MKSIRIFPHVTEKSMALSGVGQYQFIVPTWATKKDITAVINQLFDVTVASLTTARFGAKNVRFKQKSGVTTASKKATVTLVKGQTIPDFALPVNKEPKSRSKNATSPTSQDSQTPTPAVKTESQITVRSKSKKKDV